MIYAVIYKIENMTLNTEARAGHVEFLRGLAAKGVYKDAWKFPDYGDGDVHSVILIESESKEEVENIFSMDPVVSNGARSVKVRQWEPSRLLREK